jgi:hypothetical protein
MRSKRSFHGSVRAAASGRASLSFSSHDIFASIGPPFDQMSTQNDSREVLTALRQYAYLR